MANSVVTATGDGVTVQYTLNFTLGILRRDYVTCRVGSEVDGAGDPVYRTLEWVSDSIVNVQGTVPANGESIVFTRTVPKNLLIHDYSNGVPVEESNLDESNLQTIMAVHEFLDGRVEGGFLQDIQMNGYKILNLGDGTADTDAANMRQLNETTTAANAAVASTAADVTTCTTKASEASTSATESENWATKTDGIVESTDYSSKAFAIGGTGVTDTAGRGAAKEWATKAEDSTVDGTEYSAKHYAAKASASAEAASTSAASVNIVSPTASKHGALLYQNDADDGYDALTAQGTSGQVLTSSGADAAPSWQDAAGGATLQIVSASTATNGSTTATFPQDDTIPQNTEGAEVLTVSITPISATSTLVIEGTVDLVSCDAARTCISALFVDSTADAIAVSTLYVDGSVFESANVRHVLASGSTNARTYKLRIGPNAGTLYWMENVASSRLFGGAAKIRLTVTEIET